MVVGVIGVAAGAVAIPLAAVGAATSVASIAQGAGNQQRAAENNNNNNSAPKEADKNDPRLAKFTLYAHCSEEAPLKEFVEGKQVVLRDHKLYLADPDMEKRKEGGHGFAGFFIQYPWNSKPMGLVSTIQPDPPELNWIYVDKDTLVVTYGGKTQSLPHIVGPWDWTENQEKMTFEGWEGFVAMEESEGIWVLCYDQDEDLLVGVKGDKRVQECTLTRKVLDPPKASDS
ncbi:hypothetical protein EDD85DRAFT_774900 [Armillaria nabsnona]|nr:hypothetical protein EDD85DRAFT_774900 [Armillaria nabsnona]